MPIETPVMNTFAPVPVATPTQVAPVTVDPASLSVPTAVTAQSQLTGILNKGGALMQQAATQGSAQAAAKGLLNSSMGVQAAQDAVLSHAVPLATNDAATINSMATFNAGTQNQNLQSNAGIIGSANQFNATTQNQANQFNAQNENAMGQFNASQQNQATIQAMDMNSRETLAGIESNYKSLMQVNSSATDMYNQAMKSIADINASPDVADKPTAIQSQLSYLTSGMQMIQNLNGVSGLVTF